ncbi:MAG: hypothetical protein L3K19_08740 [Thermoplasmata archaeon]|nr:hypothetical protein [Thermoplasmata archaeon]
MTRSIVAAARVRPRARSGAFDAPGPDEDLFTLALEAVERLPAGPVPETVHLVGSAAEVEDWSIREVLGAPTLQVRHHAAGASSLFAVLAQSSPFEGPGAEVVVALDPLSGAGGAGAVAFRIAPTPGLSLLGHRERGHPDWKRPDASEWTDAGRRALGELPESSSGQLFLVAPSAPPVLLQRWAQRMPGFPVVSAPPSDPAVGASPTLRAALALRSLALGLPNGGSALLAVLEPGRATSFLGARSDAPLPWIGAWGGSRANPGAGNSPGAAPSLDGVSEGAYLSRATYLSELPSRWRFGADRCPQCHQVTFPVRGFCRHCGTAERLERIELPRNGLEILAATTVAPGAQPTEFDPQVEVSGAYDVVIAALAPGVRVTLQVADAPPRSSKIGGRVDTRLRRLYAMEGEWRYGLKAVPGDAVEPPTDRSA